MRLSLGLWRLLGHWDLDGATRLTLVCLGSRYAAEEWYLHADGGQTRHVISGRHILLVHETVRAVKVAICELQRGRVVIHLLQEILDEVRVVVELVGANVLLVSLVVATLLVNETAKILCQHEGCIVA